MTIPVSEKLILLKIFHEKLYVPGWNYHKSQDKHRKSLENFHIVRSCFIVNQAINIGNPFFDGPYFTQETVH